MSPILKHLQGSWKNHFSLQISTITVVTFSFVFFILMTLGAFQVSKIVNLWGSHVEMNVYIEDDQMETAQRLETQISQIINVEKVEIIDQAKNLSQFKNHLENYASAMKVEEELATLLPVSLKVQVKDVENPVETLEKISKQIRKLEMVSEVSYGQAWIQKYESFFMMVKGLGIVIAIIFFSSLLLVFMNVIRASIDSRKKDIEVLEMIGASKWMIRSPFIIEGGGLALFCAVIAMSISFAIYNLLITQLQGLILLKNILSQVAFFDLKTIFLIVVVMMCMGIVSAWLSVRKINTFFVRSESRHTFAENEVA